MARLYFKDDGRIVAGIVGDSMRRFVPSGPYVSWDYRSEEDDVPDPRLTKGGGRVATRRQDEARRDLAEAIRALVQERFNPVRVWVEEDKTGPLGGISTGVILATDIDGEIVPLSINVYSDDRIAENVDRLLERDVENAALRARLGFTEG